MIEVTVRSAGSSKHEAVGISEKGQEELEAAGVEKQPALSDVVSGIMKGKC